MVAVPHHVAVFGDLGLRFGDLGLGFGDLGLRLGECLVVLVGGLVIQV